MLPYPVVRTDRMSPLSRKLLGGVLYVAFLFAFVEGALQGFYYVTAGDFLFRRVGLAIYAAHEHSGYTVKPNLSFVHRTNEFSTEVFTNRQGFRVADPDLEYPLTPPESTYRIMLLGPSFAFGWGVEHEDSFAALVEEALDEAASFRGAEQVEVINAGVPAMPSAQQLDWFRHDGVRFQPDLVLKFAYGSLVPPPPARQRYTVAPEGYLERPERSRSQRIQAALKNSALVFYTWTTYARLQSELGAPAAQRQVRGAGRHLKLADGFSVEDPEVRRGLEFYEDLRRTVEGADAELLIVYFPLSYVVHPEDMSRWKHLGVRDVERQVAFDEAFCRSLRERGVECLDITEDLRRAAMAGERLYYWLDIHWTPRGNEVAAVAVLDHLRGSEPN